LAYNIRLLCTTPTIYPSFGHCTLQRPIGLDTHSKIHDNGYNQFLTATLSANRKARYDLNCVESAVKLQPTSANRERIEVAEIDRKSPTAVMLGYYFWGQV